MSQIIIRPLQSHDEEAVRVLFIKGKSEDVTYSSQTLCLTRWFAMDQTAPGNDMSHVYDHYITQAKEHPLRNFWVAVDEASGEIVGSIGTEESTFPTSTLHLNSSGLYESSENTHYSHIDQTAIGILMNTEVKCIELVRLTVVEHYQKRGIANQLLQAVEAQGKAQGCKYVYLTTLRDMHAAYRFYQRLDFTIALRKQVSSSVIPNLGFEGEPFDFEVVHFLREITL